MRTSNYGPADSSEVPRWSYFSESHLDEEQGKDTCYRQARVCKREVASLGHCQYFHSRESSVLVDKELFVQLEVLTELQHEWP